jgi:hypothetical protein
MLVGIGIVAMLADTPANNVIGFAIMLFAGYALLNQDSQEFFRTAWREMDFRWPDLRRSLHFGFPARKWEEWSGEEFVPADWRALIDARNSAAEWYRASLMLPNLEMQILISWTLVALQIAMAFWMLFALFSTTFFQSWQHAVSVALSFILFFSVAFVLLYAIALVGDHRDDACVNTPARAAFEHLGGKFTNLGEVIQSRCFAANVSIPSFRWILVAAPPLTSAIIKISWAPKHPSWPVLAGCFVLFAYFVRQTILHVRLQIQAMHPERHSPCRYLPLTLLIRSLARYRDGD